MTDADIMRVRRAQANDTDVSLVTGILADAFLHGDLAGWLVPDPDLRAHIYPPYFRMLAEHAIDHGLVELLGDNATALWYDLDHTPAPAIADYDVQLATITGTALTRFQQLDHAMHQHHPDPSGQPHAYLAFLAVRPGQQGKGLGAALLDHRHIAVDLLDRPAYLEATGPRNRALYRRHGYQPLEPYEVTRGGPPLFPMWRPPAAPKTRGVGSYPA
ncbi:GNAT family N-acetyltransferase [Actinoplanes sp. L3-i22]|uniref:GNAT family N-acetyltransferase n=1 Tax=Actinoplanes sp. L3-i22 TaxID=2836373 RepID=UPI001C75FCCE|nr:GNAT family N-acetyltransferase [Actinoplanes sp. L3-i22]BCY11079.1 N-acetyltransferase [Actinoplanes sp. L3-i22]